MPKHTFYLCNVCGSEIGANEPCFKALEVPEPDYVIYGSSMYGGVPSWEFNIYICKNCIPLKKYRKADLDKKLTPNEWIEGILRILGLCRR